VKTEREQEVGEEIAKCGSSKRAGSEEEMPNEFFHVLIRYNISETRTQNVRDLYLSFLGLLSNQANKNSCFG